MTDEEARELIEAERFNSIAEAVAYARACLEPGEEIELHDVDCPAHPETGEGCTCEPIVVEYKPRASG